MLKDDLSLLMGPLLFGAVFLCGLVGCGAPPVSRHQEMAMGVLNEIILVGETKAEREALLKEAFDLLHGIDQKLSHFKPASEISRINEKGFEEPQTVSRETFELIQASVGFFEKTQGAFDITVLPLVKLWGFYEGTPRYPSPEEIQATLSRIGSHQLLLDEENQRVGFRVPQMGMDLGAIGKGYACDRLIQFLQSRGLEHALVNVGGTIRVLGKASSGKPWRVGIRHPRELRTLKIVTLENEALATSGDYEQYFVFQGERYSHILDPRSGLPAQGMTAVSVIAPTAVMADVLATALFVLGPEKGAEMTSQFPGAHFILTPSQ